MKFNQKAQQVIEYLLIMAAVVAGVLGIAGPTGPMRNAVEKSLNKAVETIYQGYTWRVGTPGTCSVPCGIGEATRSVFCQREDGVTVADAYCESASGQTRVSLETVACNPANCGSYAWIGSGFGACSALCGGGTQTQTVVCRDSGGATVADTFCASAGPKPVSQPCNTQPCFVWQSGGACITTCSEVCGVGSCLQDVSCKDNVTGAKTADGNCPGTKPPTSFSCNTSLTCGFQWQVSTWSACDKACGGGTKTRTVQCIKISDGTIATDSDCAPVAKPTESSPCNTMLCHHWDAPGGWSACTVPCSTGGVPGTQTANIRCLDYNNVPVSDTLCDPATKLSSTRNCTGQPVCGYSWGATGWQPSPCPINCGTATQTQTVFCTRTNDGQDMALSFCRTYATTPEPLASQTCTSTIGCYSWVATSWGACSTTCGSGTQLKNYECRDGRGNRYVDSYCTNAVGAPPLLTNDCIDLSGCCPNGICHSYSDDNENCATCPSDCGACATCFDGIPNQGETGVDCGGPNCPACPMCTGTPAINSVICPGADQNLPYSIPYSLSNFCSGAKCQRTCSAGLTIGIAGGVAVCVPFQCSSYVPVFSTMCGGNQTTNIPTHAYPVTLSASCDGVTKCQAQCSPGYRLFAGVMCLPQTAAVCGNGIPESGEQCDNGSWSNGSCPSTCGTDCTLNSCSGQYCTLKQCTTVCGYGCFTAGVYDCSGVQVLATGRPGGCAGCYSVTYVPQYIINQGMSAIWTTGVCPPTFPP